MNRLMACWSVGLLIAGLVGCSADVEDGHARGRPAALLGEDLNITSNTTLHGEHIYDNITISNNAILSVTDYDATPGTGTLTLRARQSITIALGSSILGTGRGYRGGAGSNTTPLSGEVDGAGGGGAAVVEAGGGGGHAGAGDDGNVDNTCLLADGPAGSVTGSSAVTDITMGSGGGGGGRNGANGGDGGAAIVLSAPTITVAGVITTNGANGIKASSNCGGGGAGGLITLVTDSLNCTGALNAIGGNGEQANNDGGGGGGGWIKVSAGETLTACTTNFNGGLTGNCGGQTGASGQSSSDTDGLAGSYCGNNTVEAWEGCDHGGTPNADCDSECLITTGSLLPCEFGSQCASQTCSGSPGNPGVCTAPACEDTVPGAGQDLNCDPSTPICDTSDTPTCVVCLDDATGAAADTGCTDPVYCDSSGVPVCVAGCTDDADGTGIDTGCADPDRHCDESGSNPLCVAPVCDDTATGADVDQGAPIPTGFVMKAWLYPTPRVLHRPALTTLRAQTSTRAAVILTDIAMKAAM